MATARCKCCMRSLRLTWRCHTQVYSASLDGTVRHWEVSEGKLLKTFAVNAPIKSLVSLSKGTC